jgi:hypothetical protein
MLLKIRDGDFYKEKNYDGESSMDVMGSTSEKRRKSWCSVSNI